MLLPLFARREPTTDDVLLKRDPKAKKTDVVLYRDAACTQAMGRFPWYCNGRPTKRTKVVTVNCWRWSLNWVPAAA